MNIPIQTPINELNGKAISDGSTVLTIGLAIGEILAVSRNSASALKLSILARKIFGSKAKDYEVDAADLSLIKSEVEHSERYPVLIKGQVLEILESIKS